jgi:2-amino-4,5-dihydroxy-6-oxo-7-(phosphooxy)heptanoate synthase
MVTTSSTGKTVRMERLSRHGDGRYLFIPMDHSVSDGPIASAAGVERLVRQVCAGGADAVIVHKGRAHVVAPLLGGRHALVVHLSASTAQASDTDAKVLVGNVEEAVALGADAVSVHVNLGSDTEVAQLRDLGVVGAVCDRWGMPLLAMVYPRGPRVVDPTRADLVAHAVAVATDLGVDIVKTVMTGPTAAMADVVAGTHIPVVVAGGASDGADVEAFASTALASGCRGLAVGRRVFTSSDPERTVRALAAIVHGRDACPATPNRAEMVGVS